MGIFDSVGSFFGSATGAAKVPQYQAAGLDSQTEGLIKGQEDRSNRSNADFAGDITRGASNASNLQMGDNQMQHQNAALGMQDNQGLRQALQQRSQRQFDTNMGHVNTMANYEAPQMKFQATQMAANDLMAQQQNFNQNVMMQNQSKRQAVMARNQAITGLLGAAGSLGGAAAGAGAAKGGTDMDMSGGMGGQMGGMAGGGEDMGSFAGLV